MSLLPSVGLAVAVTMWLALFEAAPGGPIDRKGNGCSTANTNLQHGEVMRPDCRTECFCDDGVLLCKDLCTSGGLAEPCDQPQSQNHWGHSPPLGKRYQEKAVTHTKAVTEILEAEEPV
ncbi:hypothetical protein TSMEX_008372 [Taenia solium]|eukprot:TsM_001176700 transcript=TsM_001176700 gene=TsM_001176700